MHEYSIVQSLVERIEEEAARQHASSVARVRISIGDLSGVERELLATAFDTFKVGTICATSTMEIRAVPAKWRCPRCGVERRQGEVLQCSTCAVPVRLVQGDEILLEQVELEVEDV